MLLQFVPRCRFIKGGVLDEVEACCGTVSPSAGDWQGLQGGAAAVRRRSSPKAAFRDKNAR